MLATDVLEVLVLKKKELSRLLASGDLDKSTVAALAKVAEERKRENLSVGVTDVARGKKKIQTAGNNEI